MYWNRLFRLALALSLIGILMPLSGFADGGPMPPLYDRIAATPPVVVGVVLATFCATVILEFVTVYSLVLSLAPCLGKLFLAVLLANVATNPAVQVFLFYAAHELESAFWGGFISCRGMQYPLPNH